jgi:hypothetical protein
MKFQCLPLAAALLIAATPFAALAQASAPPPAAARMTAPVASVPAAGKPAPTIMTPEQKRDLATPPEEGQPAGPALQKVTIPLGKNAPAPSYSSAGSKNTGKAKSTGGVNDAAARCESLVDKQERQRCLDKLPK